MEHPDVTVSIRLYGDYPAPLNPAGAVPSFDRVGSRGWAGLLVEAASTAA